MNINMNVTATKEQKMLQSMQEIQEQQMKQLESINKLNLNKRILDDLLYKINQYKLLSSTVDQLEKIFNDNPNYLIQSSLRDTENILISKVHQANERENEVIKMRESNMRMAQEKDELLQQLHHLKTNMRYSNI